MDGIRFDTIAKAWGATRSRRGALHFLAGGGLGALLARLAPSAAAGQEAQAVCRFVGEPCTVNSHCCHGNRCEGGTCQCRPNHTNCGGCCRDLRSNENHCGECDNRCRAGETCCRGRCVDLQTNRRHCGRCGHACRTDQVCAEGTCRCPGGVPECGGVCCAAGQTCPAGTCVTPGQACPAVANACVGDRVICGFEEGCACRTTTEGVTACGRITNFSAQCEVCTSSAQCEANPAFGPGARCVTGGPALRLPARADILRRGLHGRDLGLAGPSLRHPGSGDGSGLVVRGRRRVVSSGAHKFHLAYTREGDDTNCALVTRSHRGHAIEDTGGFQGAEEGPLASNPRTKRRQRSVAEP